MINTENKYAQFIKKWKNKVPSVDLLYDYKKICSNLLYEKEEIVLKVIEILKNNISAWSAIHSEPYKFNKNYYTKEDLLNKKNWYVGKMQSESSTMKTSGSTTSNPFYYLRWNNFFHLIECENHYDLILNEFNIKNNFNLLYFFDNNIYEKNKKITIKNGSKNFMECHGTKRKSTIHYVNFKKLQNSTKYFYKFLIEYAIYNKIDVIFCPGSVTNSICHYIKKYEVKNKICSLLSNSYEEILKNDVEFLIKNNLVDNVCDHMRCWDGGATFFTCKYKTYHLLDNLSLCYEIENKLISTDYFSFPSPFVNYWNGDYCEIKDKYERCECGRLYRSFKLLRSRPFAVKGYVINDIYHKLISMNVNTVKQIKCDFENVIIISKKQIETENKKSLIKQFEKVKFKFIVE